MLTPKQWDGPRPDEPQLPLYAVAAPEDLAAVVFASVRPGEMRFMGFSRSENARCRRSRSSRTGRALLDDWKRDAEALGGSPSRTGEAPVDPEGRPEDLPHCASCTRCAAFTRSWVLRAGGEA